MYSAIGKDLTRKSNKIKIEGGGGFSIFTHIEKIYKQGSNEFTEWKKKMLQHPNVYLLHVGVIIIHTFLYYSIR